MSAAYNDYVLSTSLEQGWIDSEQHHRVEEILGQTPGVAALDFLREQQLLSEEQAAMLGEAISAAESQHPTPGEANGKTPPPGEPEGVVEAVGGGNAAPVAEGFDHVDAFLRLAREAKVSDVHLGVDAPPLMRQAGSLVPMWDVAPRFEPEQTESLIRNFLSAQQWKHLQEKKYLEFSYTSPDAFLGRFRSSIVQQRKGLNIVFRLIESDVRSMDELGLPESLKVLTRFHNGLVLVTGPVGCGKSTTLAAMVEQVNLERHDHIITLEDPIEYLFDAKGCQVSQREVHTHTKSFANALRGSLREDPDVIMVGEMRDLETISLAITAAETGHLVLGTLHTNNASRTLDRILDAFPIEQQAQIRIMVAESLRGIVSQQLIPRKDGPGRVLALEILVNTPAVANLIRESKTFMLQGVMQTGKKVGMKLMDDSLMELVESGQIDGGEAFDRAEQKNLFSRFLD
ncbi:MAG: type IV pilus twitching motility protein PilT [Verrucomicrobiota bacterium]